MTKSLSPCIQIAGYISRVGFWSFDKEVRRVLSKPSNFGALGLHFSELEGLRKNGDFGCLDDGKNTRISKTNLNAVYESERRSHL